MEEPKLSESRSTRRRLAAAAFTTLAAAAVVLPVAASSAFAETSSSLAASGDSVHGGGGITAEALAAGRARHGEHVTEAQAIVEYWSPERMRAAKPVEDSAQFTATLADDRQQTRRSGPERHIDPTEPVGDLTLAAFDPNLSYSSPTARTAGKVFMTLGGIDKVCSGTVINSEGKDTVWTAGHCVHSGQGGDWASNFAFVPAYDDDLTNPRPYGTWTAPRSGLWTMTAWINNSDFSEDMGVAIMNTLNGEHIVTKFGGQGLRVNAGKSVFDYAFGYPAETPFDGGNLFRCSGTISSHGSDVKMSCDMTRGSSGGGWLNGYDGNWGYLNGVNSRIDSIMNPTIMISPYFDDTAWTLFNATRYL